MLSIIGGTGLFISEIAHGARLKIVVTKYGPTLIYIKKEFIFIPRHGPKNNIPPHMINHKANISAFKKLKADKIISFTSVGSLKQIIKPGTIVIPDDYINLYNIQTFFNKGLHFTTPSLDKNLRKKLISIVKKLKLPLKEKGTYVQTTGPRLETKAEINLLKNYADIIGMTMANEATLAKELGIPYATISCADNYANGIVKKQLTAEQIVEAKKKNAAKLIEIFSSIIKQLS